VDGETTANLGITGATGMSQADKTTPELETGMVSDNQALIDV
jgi:hypothetical protein